MGIVHKHEREETRFKKNPLHRPAVLESTNINNNKKSRLWEGEVPQIEGGKRWGLRRYIGR
jgi:hypothetical protein